MIEKLSPSELLLVGEGFSREDLKSHLLRGSVLSGKAVFTPVSLAWEILRLSDANAPAPASPLLRQEYLQLILSHPRLSKQFPILTELRGQPGFWKKLDRALEAAQWSAIHSEERQVQLERLQCAGAPQNSYRAEIIVLMELWKGWCEGAGRADDAGAVLIASQILSSHGLPASLRFKRATFWQNGLTESLMGYFLEELTRQIPLQIVDASSSVVPDAPSVLRDERWHTIEDAAERLGDLLVDALRSEVHASSLVVLIPDSQNEVRFALSRILSERNITELDPRDPLEFGIHEPHKNIFRSLELAASDFERVALLSWLKQSGGISDSLLAQCHRTLSDLGVREGWRGLTSLLEPIVVDRLKSLEEASYKKLTLKEVMELQDLQRPHEARNQEWIRKFWQELYSDLHVLGLSEEKLLISAWLEKIHRRKDQSNAPVSRVRPRTGVRVVRLSQCNPGFENHHIFLLGLNARWLSDGQTGDLYLRVKDREILGSEFQIRSSRSTQTARLVALRSWLNCSASFSVLNHQFDMGGREQEDPSLVLRELGLQIEPEFKGAHPRQMEGYSLVKRARPREVLLAPLLNEKVGPLEMTATDLEHVSRCPFFGAVFSRWKVQSPQNPDLELWPTTQGTLLHAAVEELVKRLENGGCDGEGRLEGPCREALRSAWERMQSRGKLKGWVPSPQLRIQIERKIEELLRAFLDEEQKYRARSQTRVFATEDQAKLKLEWESDGHRFVIAGKADRIDEHSDGLWLIDYKSGKQDVKGLDIREKGYRLQLPFYAVAAERQLGRPVLGVQFIELTREARRSVGLFPKKWNGKEKGMLTQVRANHSSLYDGEPSELWSELETKIRSTAVQFAAGVSHASPVLGEKECERCRARGICGENRREWVEGQP